MDYQGILLSAKLLSTSDQSRLISDLLGLSQEDYLSFRRQQFYDKQAVCPWCKGTKYYKYGMDKGCQRFKCKECGRTFTEFTGTWLDGLHKKDHVTKYLELMLDGKSLDKMSSVLGINKKTAFDWRHKILSSLGQDRGNEMDGIVESDETFFEESQKGNRHLARTARKRGSSTSVSNMVRKMISESADNVGIPPQNDIFQKYAPFDRRLLLDKKGRVFFKWSPGRYGYAHVSNPGTLDTTPKWKKTTLHAKN